MNIQSSSYSFPILCRVLSLAMAMLPIVLHAQLTVNASNNAAALVNTLVGPGVQVFNVSMNCPNGAAGTFNGANTNLGINNGVLLTSGTVAVAAQSNISDSEGSDNAGPGDNDLTILGGDPTFNACALEFDFIAICDTISIAYVFGSEEYDEFVCAGVNDVFGFYINGPGLNNVNIATVPGSGDPVTINTVNIGQPGAFGAAGPGCITTNSAYYVSNAGGTTQEYDGQTVRLEAKTWVQPCSTYHVKLVVADGGDGVYDSGVFLEQAGIRCASQQITINTTTASGGNTLVEGCTDALLSFERSGNLSTSLTIHYTVGGIAQNGLDYTQIADSILFPSGIDSVGLLLSAPDDGLVEGLETILIIVADTNCAGSYADTAQLYIIDPPNAEFAHVSACPFSPVQFSNQSSFAGVIVQYLWDFGDGTTSGQPSPSHVYTSSGQYNVKLVIQSSEGCRDSVTHAVDIYPVPTAGWTASQFCNAIPTQFSDNSPSSGLSQWLWSFGDGGTGSGDNVSHLFATAGTYNVGLVVVDANGCRDTLSQPITIYASPVAAFTWTDVCQGSATTLTDQSTVAVGSLTTWDWTISNGLSFNQPSVGFTLPDTGTYTATLVVGSDQGCRDTLSQTMLVFPNPVPDFSLNFACLGDTTYFTDLSTVGSGSNVAWSWAFGDGNGSSQQNPFHIYLVAGDYTVNLTVTSDRGCVTSLDRLIGRPPVPPAPIVYNDTMCPGYSGVVQAFTNIPGGILHWYVSPSGGNVLSTGSSVATPPLIYTQPWYVEVLSPEGCVSDRMPVYGVVSPPPTILIAPSALELEIPNAILEYQTTDVIGNVASWNWDFGDGGSSSLSDPVHQYVLEGTYNGVLQAISGFGCISTYPLPPIVVLQNIRLYIPNAFTPNGDGLNDMFGVQSRLVTQLNVQMFDRWGAVLYASDNINFEWAGTDAQGTELPEGVYTYLIRALGYDGKEIIRTGTVTLIR